MTDSERKQWYHWPIWITSEAAFLCIYWTTLTTCHSIRDLLSHHTQSESWSSSVFIIKLSQFQVLPRGAVWACYSTLCTPMTAPPGHELLNTTPTKEPIMDFMKKNTWPASTLMRTVRRGSATSCSWVWALVENKHERRQSCISTSWGCSWRTSCYMNCCFPSVAVPVQECAKLLHPAAPH